MQSVVEHADHHHVAQRPAQRVRVEARVPGADRPSLLVEHADEAVGEVTDVARLGGDVGARGGAGGGNGDMAEIDCVAGPRGGLGNMRSEEPTSDLQSLMRISYAGF